MAAHDGDDETIYCYSELRRYPSSAFELKQGKNVHMTKNPHYAESGDPYFEPTGGSGSSGSSGGSGSPGGSGGGWGGTPPAGGGGWGGGTPAPSSGGGDDSGG